MKAKIKVNLQSAEKKILTYLFLTGKIKRYNEIEGSNVRIGIAVRKMLNKGELTKDNEGYIDINYKEHPEFEQIRTFFRDEMQRREYDIDSKTKEKISKDLKFTNRFLTELLEKIITCSKK